MTDASRTLDRAKETLRRTAQYDERGQWPSDYEWVVTRPKPKFEFNARLWRPLSMYGMLVVSLILVAIVAWVGLSWWTAWGLYVSGWLARSAFAHDDESDES